MKRFLQSEIGAAVLWVACSMLMAALITPWIYQAGMGIAAMGDDAATPALLKWLGAKAARAKYGLFFDRSLLLSALCFLPLLLRRLKTIKVAAGELAAPSKPGISWKKAATQTAVACVTAACILWTLGIILYGCDAYAPRAEPPEAGRIISKMLIPAVSASLLEEWLFRGVLLGLWLRFARPAAACVGTSLLFAFLHFLQPPSGAAILDPNHPLAGFELLGKILLHFSDPRFFVTDFATLTVVGLILAWARVRTGRLWFSIGLHSGWILAFQAFALFYRKVPDHPLRPWWVGDNLRSGILPLLMLGLTAVVCHFIMKRFPPADLTAHHGDDDDLAESRPAQGGGAFVDG